MPEVLEGTVEDVQTVTLTLPLPIAIGLFRALQTSFGIDKRREPPPSETISGEVKESFKVQIESAGFLWNGKEWIRKGR